MLWNHSIHPPRLVRHPFSVLLSVTMSITDAHLFPGCSLTTWLSHSRKKTCDVCKYPYSFTKGVFTIVYTGICFAVLISSSRTVYAPDMPARLPLWLLLRGVFDQVSATTIFILRGLIVATVWLAVLPYTTVWAWRVYFGLGDTLCVTFTTF